MILYELLAVVLLACLFLFACGYALGAGRREDRADRLAALQAAIDRCQREEWEPGTVPFPAVPFPVWSEHRALADRQMAQARAELEATEAEVREMIVAADVLIGRVVPR